MIGLQAGRLTKHEAEISGVHLLPADSAIGLCHVRPLDALPWALAVHRDAHVSVAKQEAEAHAQEFDVLVHAESNFVLLINLFMGQTVAPFEAARLLEIPYLSILLVVVESHVPGYLHAPRHKEGNHLCSTQAVGRQDGAHEIVIFDFLEVHMCQKILDGWVELCRVQAFQEDLVHTPISNRLEQPELIFVYES